jgi:predicted phage-related endonuclease
MHFESYFENKRQLKILEKSIPEIENQFNFLLDNHGIGITGAYKVKWETRSRTRVDSKQLKKTHFRQFSITKETVKDGE